MTVVKKSIAIIVLTIAGFVFGFIFLLRGCLAKYDERFIKTPVLVFEKNDTTVVFSIEEFQKTTSYSRKGGAVRKSVNTVYYVQVNDGVTAELINNKKVKNHRAIKNFPVEVLGAAGTNAWVFMGEPMAFDAFTLETKADIAVLEQKNPGLKGKFPTERPFYHFNRTDNNIYFTATDGTKWQLNTQTLTAVSSNYQKNESHLQQQLARLEQEIKNKRVLLDSLYQQKNYRPSRDYAAKKISAAEYQVATKNYYTERSLLQEAMDSLSDTKRQWEKNKRKIEDQERTIENLNRSSAGFGEIKANQDTMASNWCGLYSDEEFDKLNERVYIQNIYDETARRKLWSANYSFIANEDGRIDKAAAKTVSSTDFLAGGFLLDKQTAQPVHVKGNNSLLIIHKDVIGQKGVIQVTSITRDGRINWTYNTTLVQWNDWIFSGNQLFVFGTDNKNLSSNESNILLSINLAKGTVAKYDYFKKKKVT